MNGVNVKETTTIPGWKCQPKGTHWSLMNDEETHTTGQDEVAPKHHYSERVAPVYST